MPHSLFHLFGLQAAVPRQGRGGVLHPVPQPACSPLEHEECIVLARAFHIPAVEIEQLLVNDFCIIYPSRERHTYMNGETL